MMLVNEIVIIFIVICLEFFEELICIIDYLEVRVLRCKINCIIERSFNKKKIFKKNFLRIKICVRSKDFEIVFVFRNRNCKRKCRGSY